MHDLHLADKMLKQVMDYGAKNGLKKITGAKIKAAEISDMVDS